ncbi:MAG: mechanosensitive ion channel [Candidatus Kapabacteria bacterium]|jgi:small-conductance mechanosensitive channel|nr:mechanosensitive ion channel [Candidatus Kapabacteria bacterium]
MSLATIRLFIFSYCLLLVSYANNYSIEQDKHAIIKNEDTLGYFYRGTANLSTAERAEISNKKLSLLDINEFNDSLLIIENDSLFSLIKYNSIPLISIDLNDEKLLNLSKEVQIRSIYDNLVKSLKGEPEQLFITANIYNIIYSLLIVIAVSILIYLVLRYTPLLFETISNREFKFLKAIKFRNIDIMTPKSIIATIIGVLQLLRIYIIFLVVKYGINLVHGFWTNDESEYLSEIFDGIITSLFLTILMYYVFKIILSVFNTFVDKLSKWRGSIIKSVQIQSLEIMSEDKIADVIILIAKISRVLGLISVLYLYTTLLFGQFDYTRTWSVTLLHYALSPLNDLTNSFIAYLPNLFNIIIISAAIYYFSKLLKFIFLQIQAGNIQLPGFYEEWALPTFKITRFLLFAFGAIVIFPYLPGSDSPFFQGISIFIGVLFTLSSSSAVSNIVAGTVLTYMRPFKLGDRVKISDAEGDVIEKTLLVTRIRTIKNIDISIPNSMVLSSHIINFSSNAKSSGLIIHTTVTIGYDVPWKIIHELLIKSAKMTEGISNKHEPFVLQTALNDFSVAYEVNAYTSEVNSLAKIYSELHSHILDVFNESGIEIMSPVFCCQRR